MQIVHLLLSIIVKLQWSSDSDVGFQQFCSRGTAHQVIVLIIFLNTGWASNKKMPPHHGRQGNKWLFYNTTRRYQDHQGILSSCLCAFSECFDFDCVARRKFRTALEFKLNLEVFRSGNPDYSHVFFVFSVPPAIENTTDSLDQRNWGYLPQVEETHSKKAGGV